MAKNALSGGEMRIEIRVSAFGGPRDAGRHRRAEGRYNPGFFTFMCNKEKAE